MGYTKNERGELMVDVNKLKGAMVRAGFTQSSLAKALCLSPNTLNAKINGKTIITTDEAQEMCRVLRIRNDAEKVEIFLA